MSSYPKESSHAGPLRTGHARGSATLEILEVAIRVLAGEHTVKAEFGKKMRGGPEQA